MAKSEMVVWEVVLADAADATEADRSHGGIMPYRLPTRATCYIESTDQTGFSDEVEEAAKKIGIEQGLKRPVIKGIIRASEPVKHECLFRILVR